MRIIDAEETEKRDALLNAFLRVADGDRNSLAIVLPKLAVPGFFYPVVDEQSASQADPRQEQVDPETSDYTGSALAISHMMNFALQLLAFAEGETGSMGLYTESFYLFDDRSAQLSGTVDEFGDSDSFTFGSINLDEVFKSAISDLSNAYPKAAQNTYGYANYLDIGRKEGNGDYATPEYEIDNFPFRPNKERLVKWGASKTFEKMGVWHGGESSNGFPLNYLVFDGPTREHRATRRGLARSAANGLFTLHLMDLRTYILRNGDKGSTFQQIPTTGICSLWLRLFEKVSNGRIAKCEVCGRLYPTGKERGTKSRYCSDKCKEKHHYAVTKERRKAKREAEANKRPKRARVDPDALE